MVVTISNSKLTASINSKGAELVSLQNLNSKREYIWDGNPEYWGKHAPILFPIVGTLKNDSYCYNGINFELHRHGFARDMEFTLVSKDDDKVLFLLQYNDATLKFYPFKFELQLLYSIVNCQLNITYSVTNIGFEDMPFSIGGHPAFSLPEPFECYELVFETNENLLSYQLQDGLLSNKTKEIKLQDTKLPLSYSLFENDALIFKTMNSKQIQIVENGIAIVNFKFHDFPNFGIWTKLNAPFICLEPWLGYSDKLDSTGNILVKEGIQLLEPINAFNCSYNIAIL